MCERQREREGERERERGREGETFAQLVHLVIPVPATACMSACLLFCGFVSERFDLQHLLLI